MKKLLFLLAATIAGAHFAHAECAIYVCPYTGAWGASYEDGVPPYADINTLKDEAYLNCKKQGGTDCQFYYSNNCRGCWWAFIVGNDGYNINYMASWSYESKLAAEMKVRSDYQKNNGVAYATARVTSWYVPGY